MPRLQSGCRGDLGPLFDDSFALLTDVCREVAEGDVRAMGAG
jgi:hypothetical protein